MNIQPGKVTGTPEGWKAPAALQPLTALPHWMVWRLQTVAGKDGQPKLDDNGKPRFTKVPYQPDGSPAKSNDPRTWSTFDAVMHVAHNYDGIGFALLGSGLAAFDIDDCRDPSTTGAIHPWAIALVDATGSYAEVTPSGTGLRILGYGQATEVHRKLPVKDGVTCELYRQATRYITISGNVYRDAPLINIDEHIDRVLAELDDKKKPQAERRTRPPKDLPLELRLMLHAQGDKPADYASRSELLWAFLGVALRKGLDEQGIIAACLDEAYAGNSIYEHVNDAGGQPYLEKQIEKAINDDGTTDDSAKAIIRITSGNLNAAWRVTERALIRNDCPVYVRGQMLVQPLWRWEKTAEKNRDVLVTRFSKLNLVRLRDIVAHHAAIFQKFDKREKQWKPIDPPKEVIETLLEAGHWGFNSVVGIVNSPTMRRDGTLLTEPGYDPATQLWYKPAGDIALPPIPERPTREEALAALRLLQELLAGFPFVGDVDRSVAIAALMTVVLRGAFEAAPMFFIRAPEAGTGKTYLVMVISTIATGRIAAALIGTPSKEEMEKRLTAAAVEAKPILNLNNLTFDLESGMLCQMVTDGTVGIRPFGKNEETIPCDCRAITVFANGNNIRVVGDLVRRTLTCALDAQCEQPETRMFDFDPVERVKADRGAYLAAVFTIVRAHMAADSPKPDSALNIAGFEGWSRFVQHPLLWLGQADPMKSMEDARAKDPVRAALAERLTALVECMGTEKEFTAADVHKLAMETVPAPTGYPRPKYPNLLEAFNSRDGKKIDVNSKTIGNQLMNDLNRRSGGYHVVLAKPDPKKANRYRIAGPPVAPKKEEDLY